MAKETFKVVVIGAGLAGLTLAQALRTRGVDVEVHERDTAPTDRSQGYRIHINPTGTRALRACLSDELFQLFLDTSGSGGQGLRFTDHLLRPLLSLDGPHSADPLLNHQSVCRVTLRHLLLRGLDDVVRFGRHYERYEELRNGSVVAHFADGSTARGDVLVGADGCRSRVRAQRLPQARVMETGAIGVAGKLPLDEELRSWIHAPLLASAHIVMGPHGARMFAATHEYRNRPSKALDLGTAGTGGLLFDTDTDYLMWAVTASPERFALPADTSPSTPRQLGQAVLRLVDGWHPVIRRAVTDADPETLTGLPVRSAVAVPDWAPSRVTLIGDAAHCATPLGGMGGNMALRDAELLYVALVEAARGIRPVAEGIGRYETAMRAYAADAVLKSRKNLDRSLTENRMSRAVTRATFRMIDRIPSVKRRMAAEAGG
ncbi:NAD(P)/FAD-dependent oxidoreductase [Streptomyces sp. DASNCL29]|uniref:FAD-dependent oxidoreductase n=1 Tax=Streptomyces sp. DASNCL29 TaxID=2583819 RepID=UPI00110FF719|nr:NAD(P)/FAD-dependent oxidoreductase [Streptomyces sp. DASNCL29]TMU99979.1 FAD-dependent monooxygenase [Streptomyces sp. DASNCL29]